MTNDDDLLALGDRCLRCDWEGCWRFHIKSDEGQVDRWVARNHTGHGDRSAIAQQGCGAGCRRDDVVIGDRNSIGYEKASAGANGLAVAIFEVKFNYRGHGRHGYCCNGVEVRCRLLLHSNLGFASSRCCFAWFGFGFCRSNQREPA